MALMEAGRSGKSGRTTDQNRTLDPHPRNHDVAAETVIVGQIAPSAQTTRNGGLEELHLQGKVTDKGEVEFILSKFVRDSSWDGKRYCAYAKGSQMRLDRKAAENLCAQLETLFKEADAHEGNV